jgi:hypothetical protein
MQAPDSDRAGDLKGTTRREERFRKCLMAKHRTGPGKLGQEVLKEYNHRCAICGEDRPQIHHIDENPANHERFNLLPLCPNCHLTDQHNPTARPDPGLLRLFREFKDPTILSPQFLPLFQRSQFLCKPHELFWEELNDRVLDLLGFIAELEMGSFYARSLQPLLIYPLAFFDETDPRDTEEQKKERAQRKFDALVRLRCQIQANQAQVYRLIVELLRYQPWRSDRAGVTPNNR